MTDAVTTANNILSSLWSFLAKGRAIAPGEDEHHLLEVEAVPGLMTLLDVALYRAHEGGLTATVCSGHALLCAWIDLKHQSQTLLQVLLNTDIYPKEEATQQQRRIAESAESYARLCLDVASDALDRLTTDKLAQSANEYNEQGGSGGDIGSSISSTSGTSSLLGVGSNGIIDGVLESIRAGETGRRNLLSGQMSSKECWESTRLYCPDYVWADDALLACQRLLRSLTKHPFYTEITSMDGFVTQSVITTLQQSGASLLSTDVVNEAKLLVGLVTDDIPIRLHQFRVASEADTVVSKRLYLVKCEYRAPFRAFLEAHQTIQKSPDIELVNEYIGLQKLQNKLERRRSKAEHTLKQLLEAPVLTEMLILEQQCEQLEIDMAKTIFPFAEFARLLDHKRALFKAVPGVLENSDIPMLQETTRRLKYLLCRKSGPETSTGIRPLLLDLQGVPREETYGQTDPLSTYIYESGNMSKEDEMICRTNRFLEQLLVLRKLTKNNSAFQLQNKKDDLNVQSYILRGCSDIDVELFRAQCEDWYAMVKRQRDLTNSTIAIEDGGNGNDSKTANTADDDDDNNNNTKMISFNQLSERIRLAEIEVSMAKAPEQALGLVKQRIESKENDRIKRFEVLKDMVEDVCLREMNLHIKVNIPNKDLVLEFPNTSALGVFGVALQYANEPLPMG